MQKKYFTLQEAQKILDEIKYEIKRIIELKASLDLINSVDIEYTDEYAGNYDEIDFTKMNKEFHKLAHEFYSKIEVIENKGCVLKDLDEGLIDFYSIYNGREILLCWKYGEHNIEYWHDLDSGFTGRQHVKNLLANKKVN